MHIAIGLLVVLVVNALPIWGYFGLGLDPAQLLVLFWLENLLQTLLIGARILIHRRLTRKRGHWSTRVETTRRSGGVRTKTVNEQGSSFLAFLIPCLVFTIAHGIFVVILAHILLPAGADFQLFAANLKLSAQALTVAMGLGFLADLVGIRQRPYAWIRQMAELALGRVVAIHLILLGGLFVMTMFGNKTLVLVALLLIKFSADVSSVLPQAKTGAKPPKWLGFLNRIKVEKGESFEEHWAREHREEIASQARDEEVLSEEDLARITRK